MDPAIRARRLAIARDRIGVAALALAERHGLHAEAAAVAAAVVARADVRDVISSEAIAALLDAIVAAEGAAQPEMTPERELAALAAVGPRLAATLVERGITNVVALRETSDDDLLAIEGVGPATVRKIRAELGTPQAADGDAGDDATGDGATGDGETE